jgi:hypothetical protein
LTLVGLAVGCVFFLNVLGGLIAGVWLAVYSEWRLIILGFMFSFIMPFVWIIASLPAIGLATLLFSSNDAPTRFKMATGGFVTAAWSAALVAVWTLFVFHFFMVRAEPGTAIALLIWGYSTTMAPLSYMASKEPNDSVGTSLALLLAVIAYAFLALLYFAGASTPTMIAAVALLAMVEAVLATSLGVLAIPPRTSGGVDEVYADGG